MSDKGSAIDNNTSLCNDLLGTWNCTVFAARDTIENILSELIERAIVNESPYVKTSLTMQLAVKALQKVDYFAQNQQATLSKSQVVPTGFSETLKSEKKTDKAKKVARANDTYSFLTSLSSSDDSAQHDHLGWNIKNDLLLFENRLYIPQQLLCRESLHLNHADLLAGHCGAAQTLELFQRNDYWPGMTNNIREYMETCDICH